jgi:alpha-glucosidase
MFVVYDSPLQMVADSLDAYENAAGFDFVRDVPASWDETRFLQGTIAEYLVLARRKGHTWYIGAMTNETARELTVPLDFLGSGDYRSQVWEDGAAPQELVQHHTQVERGDKLMLKLAPGGGAVARLEVRKL